MKIKLASLAVLALTACTQQKMDSAGASEQAGPKAHLTQADIRVIAPEPAAAGQMDPYHKLGSDAVALVTPMQGKGPTVALIGPGEHDMAMMQDGCKFTVVVTLKNVKDAAVEPQVLNLSIAGEKTVILPGSDLEERRVEIVMDPSAENNYSCNVMLRKKS